MRMSKTSAATAAGLTLAAITVLVPTTARAATPSPPPTSPSAPGTSGKPPAATAHQGKSLMTLTSGTAKVTKTRPNGTTATEALIRIESLYTRTPGQCLDADAASAGGNGTKVQVWQCNGTDQQEWIAWDDGSIESAHFPGMCLDADLNGGGLNGTRVQLWQCNGSLQQKWYGFKGDLAIYNMRFNNNNNTVLDRDANQPGNGAQAQLWAKDFQSQQWWKVVQA